MYLKQKLKQQINLALSLSGVLSPSFFGSEQKWNCTTRQQKMRKGKGCVHVRKRESKAMLKSIEQASAYLSVSRSTVYRLIESGKLKRVYVRAVPRITQASLLHLVGERNA